MSVLRVRTFGDPVLRAAARPVEDFDATVAKLAEDMLETMYEAHGVGLAGPQVGVSKRLFVFDDGETGPSALVNPELSDAQGEQDGEEGCLSLPGIYFDLRRFMSITAEGFDVHGQPLRMEAEGLLARIFQHEVDHLNGKLFIDRLPPEQRREAMRQMREQDLAFHSQVGDASRAL